MSLKVEVVDIDEKPKVSIKGLISYYAIISFIPGIPFFIGLYYDRPFVKLLFGSMYIICALIPLFYSEMMKLIRKSEILGMFYEQVLYKMKK